MNTDHSSEVPSKAGSIQKPKPKKQYVVPKKELDEANRRIEGLRTELRSRNLKEEKKNTARENKAAERKKERNDVAERLAGKTIRDVAYIHKVNLWIFRFNDESSLILGAATPDDTLSGIDAMLDQR